jgi:hypothetical protein
MPELEELVLAVIDEVLTELKGRKGFDAVFEETDRVTGKEIITACHGRAMNKAVCLALRHKSLLIR